MFLLQLVSSKVQKQYNREESERGVEEDKPGKREEGREGEKLEGNAVVVLVVVVVVVVVLVVVHGVVVVVVVVLGVVQREKTKQYCAGPDKSSNAVKC